MGGLGPGIGGLEYLVIGIVALVVVGPERLPGMLRQLGKLIAKARGMANDFRSSFDEMARQSELDDLRKEVEALRTGQGSVGQNMVRLGDEANAAFKDIKTELEKADAAETASAAVVLNRPEFPDPVMTPLAAQAVATRVRKPRAKPATTSRAEGATAPIVKRAASKPSTTKPAAPKPVSAKGEVKAATPAVAAKTRAPRKTKATT